MNQDAQNVLKFPVSEVREVPLDQIEPDKTQPRKEFKTEELIESIKVKGQLYPILLTTGDKGKYKIVDGERRWRAYKILAGQAKDNAELAGKDFTKIRAIYVDGDSQLLGILGNIVRNSYNPMETADALALIKKSLGKEAKDADVGKQTGKSRSIVVEYLSLLKLPKGVQDKARQDSCVPFRRLKSLAASKDSESIKMASYNKLHKKYSTPKPAPKADKTSTHNRATRSFIAVRKKVDGINDALEKIKFEGVDESERQELVVSLQETIKTAQDLLSKL